MKCYDVGGYKIHCRPSSVNTMFTFSCTELLKTVVSNVLSCSTCGQDCVCHWSAWLRRTCSLSHAVCPVGSVLLVLCSPKPVQNSLSYDWKHQLKPFGLGAGLSLRAKFNSGRTWKTPFLRCFGLKTLQIRGVNFKKRKKITK